MCSLPNGLPRMGRLQGYRGKDERAASTARPWRGSISLVGSRATTKKKAAQLARKRRVLSARNPRAHQRKSTEPAPSCSNSPVCTTYRVMCQRVPPSANTPPTLDRRVPAPRRPYGRGHRPLRGLEGALCASLHCMWCKMPVDVRSRYLRRINPNRVRLHHSISTDINYPSSQLETIGH